MPSANSSATHSIHQPLSRTERLMFFLLFAGILAFRIFYTSRFRIDSDEPQHLHVVWGWLNGFLPYRDVFDNHTPLFQFLCTPLLWLTGERAEGLIWMRFAMLPLQGVVLWCVYRLGATLFSQRTGLWAAVLTGYQHRYLLISTEFRPDDMWAALWMLALCILLTKPLTLRRAFWCGVILGASFAVSLKTTLLLISLCTAMSVGLLAKLMVKQTVPWKWITLRLGVALLGMLVIPLLVCAGIAALGIWKEFHYCTITHNVMPGLGRWGEPPRIERWSYLAFLALAIPLSCWLVRTQPDRDLGLRRSMMFTSAGSIITLLYSYWPLIERETLLPFIPSAMIIVAPFLMWPAAFLTPRHQDRAIALHVLPLGMVACLIGLMINRSPLSEDKAAAFVEQIRLILKLTDNKDLIMDAKGESIFRHRPFYYILEPITLKRMASGSIADDIPQRMINSRTCVATLNGLRGDDAAFVRDNYLHIGPRVLVAGRKIPRVQSDAPFEFNNLIAARYALVGTSEAATAMIDGQPFTAPVFLDAGPHTIQINNTWGAVALVWAQATERGFSPFAEFSVTDQLIHAHDSE